MLSLLAIVVLIATLMTLFYQRISRGIGSAVFVVVWLLSAFLAPWLVHPVSLILLPSLYIGPKSAYAMAREQGIVPPKGEVALVGATTGSSESSGV